MSHALDGAELREDSNLLNRLFLKAGRVFMHDLRNDIARLSYAVSGCSEPDPDAVPNHVAFDRSRSCFQGLDLLVRAGVRGAPMELAMQDKMPTMLMAIGLHPPRWHEMIGTLPAPLQPKAGLMMGLWGTAVLGDRAIQEVPDVFNLERTAQGGLLARADRPREAVPAVLWKRFREVLECAPTPTEIAFRPTVFRFQDGWRGLRF